MEIPVQMEDIAGYDPQLEDRMMKAPEETLMHFNRAAAKVGEEEAGRKLSLKIILIKASWDASSLRALGLQSDRVGTLIKVEGLIVSTKKPGVKLTTVELRCRGCGHQISVEITGRAMLLVL